MKVFAKYCDLINWLIDIQIFFVTALCFVDKDQSIY